jgi:hypothetical protein
LSRSKDSGQHTGGKKVDPAQSGEWQESWCGEFPNAFRELVCLVLQTAQSLDKAMDHARALYVEKALRGGRHCL